MKQKFGNFGTLLTRSQVKNIVGGYMVEDPSSCTVDCTG